jgi:glycosyltransferase involved in cell wall biosynthesis
VRIAVVPIVNGMGARVKFGETLASGAAVVATSEGAEGFDAEGTFARADDPDAFASACVSLLEDGEKAAALGCAGRELALKRLPWSTTSSPLVNFVWEQMR